MQFTSKLSPEQWAEARRLRAGGTSYAEIGRRFGVHADTVRSRACKEAWPTPGGMSGSLSPCSGLTAPGRAAAASTATSGIRSRLALRLYRVLECKIRIMEMRMHRQLQAHLAAGADGADAAPPPPGKDERDALAALIASINQVTEMASDPTPAAKGRRKAATGAVNFELTALSDDIDPDGLAIASEKDQYRRELAEHLGKLFPKS